MKKYPWIVVALLIALTAYSQAPNPPPGAPNVMPPGAPSAATIERDSVNYLIRVEWKVPNGEPKFLEVLSTEGQFDLNTIEKNPVKINGNDVPTTLKFSGSINAIGSDKARVRLFLGRTVPYITSTTTGSVGSGSMSSYQQMQVGLNSTFNVKFGKSVVVQNDENGQISVLVKKQD
jgi:hypothetical protein